MYDLRKMTLMLNDEKYVARYETRYVIGNFPSFLNITKRMSSLITATGNST